MILAIQEICEIRFYLVGNPYVAEKTMTLRNRAPSTLQFFATDFGRFGHNPLMVFNPCTNHDPPSRSRDQSSTSFFTLSGLPLAFQFPPPDETGATLKKRMSIKWRRLLVLPGRLINLFNYFWTICLCIIIYIYIDMCPERDRKVDVLLVESWLTFQNENLEPKTLSTISHNLKAIASGCHQMFFCWNDSVHRGSFKISAVNLNGKPDRLYPISKVFQHFETEQIKNKEKHGKTNLFFGLAQESSFSRTPEKRKRNKKKQKHSSKKQKTSLKVLKSIQYSPLKNHWKTIEKPLKNRKKKQRKITTENSVPRHPRWTSSPPPSPHDWSVLHYWSQRRYSAGPGHPGPRGGSHCLHRKKSKKKKRVFLML